MTIRRRVSPLLTAGMAMCVLSAAALAGQAPGAPAVGAAASAAAPTDAVQPALVTVDDVRGAMASGAEVVFLDSRASVTGDMIDGAAHVTVDGAEAWAKGARKDAFVVTYCACASEGGSKALAAKLASLGFTNVRALRGGIGAWRAAGLPTMQAGAK